MLILILIIIKLILLIKVINRIINRKSIIWVFLLKNNSNILVMFIINKVRDNNNKIFIHLIRIYDLLNIHMLGNILLLKRLIRVKIKFINEISLFNNNINKVIILIYNNIIVKNEFNNNKNRILIYNNIIVIIHLIKNKYNIIVIV